jgi:hypothetical protein
MAAIPRAETEKGPGIAAGAQLPPPSATTAEVGWRLNSQHVVFVQYQVAQKSKPQKGVADWSGLGDSNPDR